MGPSEEFGGTERFSVRRRIGSGGMGVVYHVYDREKGLDVALKTLHALDATALYRLKREFRTLAGIHHPNLVTLYELISERDRWFFTMELIRGVSFLDFVSRTARNERAISTVEVSKNTFPGSRPTDDDETEVLVGFGGVRPSRPPPLTVPEGGMVAFDRLRDALRQVAEGLVTLHLAGKLHRDIKPSNVLVNSAGRAVILDFGLATDLSADGTFTSSTDALVGTFQYMAPERGSRATPTPASDWYSVGVMLFEALTGQLPFRALGIESILRKQKEDAPRPSSFVRGVPRDLEELCVALLARRPEDRPSGDQVLDQLGAGRSVMASASMIGIRPHELEAGPFVGRHRHLAALEAAYAATGEGGPVAIFVRGDSGIGKTALVSRFLSDLRTRDRVIVLTGRCYERENVPYKAVDSLVDAIGRQLGRLPLAEAQALLPREIRALARLFPSLERAEAVARAPRLPAETPDQQELRRRAFRALRELIGRFCDQAPVVIHLDDLQWADVDSAELVLDLLRPPEAPPFLLVGCFRAEDETLSPALRALLKERGETLLDVRVLTVGPLASEEAVDLALTYLGKGDEPALMQAKDIAKESLGSPFFIQALTRHAALLQVQGTDPELRLEAILERRIQRLEPSARRLLEIVAVAGRPIRLDLALWAAGTPAQDEGVSLDALRAASLVRGHKSDDGEMLETYHDRIRSAVTHYLPPEELKERHRALAVALESQGGDAEALLFHFRSADAVDRASVYAAQAAEEAAKALAFGRAANLFRTAIQFAREADPQHPGRPEVRALVVRLAETLGSAGRGADAARTFLEAAVDAEPEVGLDLRRRAMEQYLVSGHVDHGMAVLEQVLDEVGVRVPKTASGAFTSRVLQQAQLWARGLVFERVPPERISATDRIRVDILWATASGFGLVDHARGSDFQMRHLLEALRVGDPYRVGRAVAMEAAYSATLGGRAEKRTRELIEFARRLATELSDQHLAALAVLAEGVLGFLTGAWSEAVSRFEEGDRMLRDFTIGAVWERGLVRFFYPGALSRLGRVHDLTRFVSAQLDEAEMRGDLLQATGSRIGHSNMVWLYADNPERARRLVDEAMGQWSHRGVHLQHYLALMARARIAIYTGRGGEAYERIKYEWESLKDSMIFRTQYIHLECLLVRARAALAAIEEGSPARDRLLAEATADLNRVDAEGMPWTRANALLLRAGIAIVSKNAEAAAAALTEAVAGFSRRGEHVLEKVARLRLGELLGGRRGAELQRNATEWLLQQGVRNPMMMSRLEIPARP